jgi:hypothetical protein
MVRLCLFFKVIKIVAQKLCSQLIYEMAHWLLDDQERGITTGEISQLGILACTPPENLLPLPVCRGSMFDYRYLWHVIPLCVETGQCFVSWPFYWLVGCVRFYVPLKNISLRPEKKKYVCLLSLAEKKI